MRKLFSCLLFALLPLFLWGNNNENTPSQIGRVTFKHQFTTRKSTFITSQKVSEYLVQYMNYSQIPNEPGYTGAISSIFPERDRSKKSIHSCTIEVYYRIEGKRVIFDISYSDIAKHEVLCDKSQTRIDTPLEASTISKDLRGHLDYISDDLVDHIRDYVNKDEREVSKHFITPIWWFLSYIVDDGSISYYSVINSEKNLTKEELYNIAENFFTYQYRSGKAVIENKDPERFVITGKGTYAGLAAVSISDVTIHYEAPHIITIQCRDGRVRATITLSTMDASTRAFQDVRILEYEPFTDREFEGLERALIAAEGRIAKQFIQLKDAIDNGLTSLDTMEDW